MQSLQNKLSELVQKNDQMKIKLRSRELIRKLKRMIHDSQQKISKKDHVEFHRFRIKQLNRSIDILNQIISSHPTTQEQWNELHQMLSEANELKSQLG